MSNNSEKSFTGKAHHNENKKKHKTIVMMAAVILIVAALAWTTLYTQSLMTTGKLDKSPIEPVAAPSQTTAP